MSWSKINYPDSMKNLEENTRNKAIEIANSLLRDDYDEPRSIAIAISQANEWASKRKIIESNGDNQHVVPDKGNWAILKEGNKNVSHVFENKENALKKAKLIATKENVRVIIHKKDGKIKGNIIP